MKLWLKWETLDIAAILEAIDEKSDLESKKNSILSRRSSKQKELEKLKLGKSTIKTMFKS